MEGRIASKSKEKAGDLFQLVFVLSRGVTQKTDRCAGGNGLVFLYNSYQAYQERLRYHIFY